MNAISLRLMRSKRNKHLMLRLCFLLVAALSVTNCGQAIDDEATGDEFEPNIYLTCDLSFRDGRNVRSSLVIIDRKNKTLEVVLPSSFDGGWPDITLSLGTVRSRAFEFYDLGYDEYWFRNSGSQIGSNSQLGSINRLSGEFNWNHREITGSCEKASQKF